MKLEKLEEKLDYLKKLIKEDEEIFKKIKGFKNYEVSNMGRVRSLDKKIFKLSPRGGKKTKYVYKGKILTPLFTGPDRRWVQVRLTNEKNSWRQLSIVKLMISTFLNISIDKLPHSLYCLDLNSKNINLHNLTFIRKKIGR